MANVFIHFEPIQKINGPVEYTGDLPPYVIPGSAEEQNWRRHNPDGHKIIDGRGFTTGSTDAHHYARNGDIESLKAAIDRDAKLVNARDKNGWTPLHEAIRHGDAETVRLLLDRGAEVNLRVGEKENGGSSLYLAKQFHDSNHPVVSLLQERGGKVYRPGAEL